MIRALVAKKKQIYFTLLVILLVLVFCFFLGEVLLRLIPIPGVQFKATKYNSLVGYGFTQIQL